MYCTKSVVQNISDQWKQAPATPYIQTGIIY